MGRDATKVMMNGDHCCYGEGCGEGPCSQAQTSQEKLGYNVELKGPGAVARDWKCAKRNKNDRKRSVLGLGR